VLKGSSSGVCGAGNRFSSSRLCSITASDLLLLLIVIVASGLVFQGVSQPALIFSISLALLTCLKAPLISSSVAVVM
jgi:hypothetical protein